jgi:hypothetical protein
MRLPAAFVRSIVPKPLLRHGGAGEWPCRRFAAKSCLDGVVFDVMDCALLFDRISYATVKIVFAPERACSAQQSIRLLCAGHLDPRDHSGQVNKRADQKMNVVGHHDPASQFAEALLLPSRKGIRHCPGDVVTTQPLRTGRSRVENPIEGDEFRALAGPKICISLHGKRTGKTPRQKTDGSRAIPMGQARMKGCHVYRVPARRRNSHALDERDAAGSRVSAYFQAEYTGLPTRYAGFAPARGRNFWTRPLSTSAV